MVSAFVKVEHGIWCYWFCWNTQNKHHHYYYCIILYMVCMIIGILHGHSACIVNSLVLSQSLTWWIIKNQHSNGNLWHSFEQNILEDIQQTQVNIKHRAYLQNHFLGEPTVDPPNLFTGDLIFPGWRIPGLLPILQAFGWYWHQQFLDVLIKFLDLLPHLISPFFSMISSVFALW